MGNVKCGHRCEIWSRVVGFYRPIESYNPGAKAQYHDRLTYDLKLQEENKKGESKKMSKKWEGWDTANDISLSRILEVSYENEDKLRIIAKNNGYNFKGFSGNKMLLINKKSNDQFHANIGDYLRIMRNDLEKVTAEEFAAGWEIYLPSSEIERRLQALEGK